jgi:ParB family chromosome partitioning protein
VAAELEGRRRLADAFLISTDRIVADPNQPRRIFDEQQLAELADSIRERGIKQPLTVRWDDVQQKYLVIDGGRRFQAAAQLGVAELPCWIQRTEGKELLIDQIVHNWQRAELSPTDMATALGRLRDEHGLSQQEIARLTAKPKGEISKYLAIHDHASENVKELARPKSDAEKPKLSKRHLYNLSRLPTAEQEALAKRIVGERLTAIDTERLVDERVGGRPKGRSQGVAARVHRISTPLADIVLTFRKSRVGNADVIAALEEALEKELAGTGGSKGPATVGMSVR